MSIGLLFLQPKYALDLIGGQESVLADRQTSIRQKADPDAAQFQDRMSDGFEHCPDLAIFPLCQSHFVPAISSFL